MAQLYNMVNFDTCPLEYLLRIYIHVRTPLGIFAKNIYTCTYVHVALVRRWLLFLLINDSYSVYSRVATIQSGVFMY